MLHIGELSCTKRLVLDDAAIKATVAQLGDLQIRKDPLNENSYGTKTSFELATYACGFLNRIDSSNLFSMPYYVTKAGVRIITISLDWDATFTGVVTAGWLLTINGADTTIGTGTVRKNYSGTVTSVHSFPWTPSAAQVKRTLRLGLKSDFTLRGNNFVMEVQ